MRSPVDTWYIHSFKIEDRTLCLNCIRIAAVIESSRKNNQFRWESKFLIKIYEIYDEDYLRGIIVTFFFLMIITEII